MLLYLVNKGGVTASTGVNEVKGCMPRILSASLKRQKNTNANDTEYTLAA